MKDGIDYMYDERRAAAMRLQYDIRSDGTPAAFEAGWDAACEAMHAKVGVWLRSLEAAHARAEAKETQDRKANPSMWPATESAKEQDGKYWAVPKDNGYYVVHTYCALFYKLDGTVWDSSLGSMRKAIAFWNAVPCATEAEARRVAGFPEENP
jgi:hypothetical protein